jgi:hypothetical protein
MDAQLIDIVMRAVGQVLLGLGPDEFVGIEFRRIAGEGVYLQAGLVPDEGSDISAPVDLAPVPEEDHGPRRCRRR